LSSNAYDQRSIGLVVHAEKVHYQQFRSSNTAINGEH
jgi:hypothetical protein